LAESYQIRSEVNVRLL